MKEKHLMVDDYMVDIALDKIKKIRDINKFDNTKILIARDENLPYDFTFKML